MKKNVIVILLLIYTFFILFSCVTTQVYEEKSKASEANNEKNIETEKEFIPVTEIVYDDVPDPDPAAEYEDKAGSVILSPLVLPSPSIKGNSFTKPFTIKVTNPDGNIAPYYPITIKYPHSITEGEVVFTTIDVMTNEKGIVEFLSPPSTFSCNSFISFYPTPEVITPSILQIIQRISLKIPYLVKTNLTNEGGSICLVDYDKQGRAITNNGLTSSAVLGYLIRSGFSRIGNAEFYSEVAAGDYDFLYKKAKDLFGSITSYFIYGTVQYLDTPQKNEQNEYTVNLIADIICIDMKSNNQLYKTSLKVTGTGKTESSALNNARNDQLAPLLAEKIMYGM